VRGNALTAHATHAFQITERLVQITERLVQITERLVQITERDLSKLQKDYCPDYRKTCLRLQKETCPNYRKTCPDFRKTCPDYRKRLVQITERDLSRLQKDLSRFFKLGFHILTYIRTFLAHSTTALWKSSNRRIVPKLCYTETVLFHNYKITIKVCLFGKLIIYCENLQCEIWL
jgi:hypothetical protein